MVFVINVPILIVLGIIGLGFFYFLLVFTSAWKTRRLRKKYKEELDKSKLGEKNREETGRIPFTEIRTRYPSLPTGTNTTTTSTREPVVKGFDKLEGGELLPTTSSDADGNTEPVVRKNSSRIGRIFERRRGKGLK